jgi:hypothetical protein
MLLPEQSVKIEICVRPDFNGKNKYPFYAVLKRQHCVFECAEITSLFSQVDEDRVNRIASRISDYISCNLPNAFDKRQGLCDYRTNPYVLMTSASVMHLDDPSDFADFLFNTKFYMALETSFGKSIEAAFVEQYPLCSGTKWEEPEEKIKEFESLKQYNNEEKAKKRVNSVWREIDKSVVINDHRYLVTIKSGPNTINDTQVQAMTTAIIDYHRKWAHESKHNHLQVKEIDIVIGLTYGTDKTTNNKENQILAKLLNNGFCEEDRFKRPGVLIDEETRSIRVYRKIGKDFWSFIGNPTNPSITGHIFLEILLALSKALSSGIENGKIEDKVNKKIQELSIALAKLQFPRKSLPEWISEDFNESELFWFTTAMSAFFDEGI